ncbi:MAG: hypothetical protein LBT59_30005 [Clostridiales bacterium]|jgi:hypothetical protein|nr:hypothetical protein [Clostridiales bacterium]
MRNQKCFKDEETEILKSNSCVKNETERTATLSEDFNGGLGIFIRKDHAISHIEEIWFSAKMLGKT